MNEELKRKCLPIGEYSFLSNAYKHFRQQKMEIDHAVDAAVKYCLENNVMVDYLKNNQKNVIDMFDLSGMKKKKGKPSSRLVKNAADWKGKSKP